MEEPFSAGRLAWDFWNLDHITKHGVTAKEVQEVVDGDFVELQGYKRRTVLIGRSQRGRDLAVILGRVPGDPGAYYCFSARPASRRERRIYRERYGGT